MNPEIIASYDRLAPLYDQDRFGNSYGRFVDARERALIERHAQQATIAEVVHLRPEIGKDRGRAALEARIDNNQAALLRRPRYSDGWLV